MERKAPLTFRRWKTKQTISHITRHQQRFYYQGKGRLQTKNSFQSEGKTTRGVQGGKPERPRKRKRRKHPRLEDQKNSAEKVQGKHLKTGKSPWGKKTPQCHLKKSGILGGKKIESSDEKIMESREGEKRKISIEPVFKPSTQKPKDFEETSHFF